MVRIPSEYQEVEYIESTGTQYIDLPFGFDPTDEIETKFSIATSQSNDKYIVSPNRWNDNANRFALGVHMGGLYTAGFGNNYTGTTILSPHTSNDGKIHEWIYNNYVFSISDVLASKDVSNITFKATTTNLRLFYGYNSNTKGKIVYYHHKKADGTEINLIPCYRKSDNEIGMYDTVTKTFFTNQGTGTFLKGNDVNYDTVNLMESRRRILLNTPHLESLSGSALSFKTDMASKLKECRVHFTPIQEGTGDPSPDNVRPIHGWDGVSLNVNGTTLTIPFPQTIYGGYVDLVKGEVVEEWKEYTYSARTNVFTDHGNGYYEVGFGDVGGKGYGSASNSMCSKLSYGFRTSTPKIGYELNYVLLGRSNRFHTLVYSDTPITKETARQWFIDNNIQLVRLVYTPNTYPLDPVTIRTLKGLNNIWSDANGNIEIKYWTH